jgi:hypothetical protein
MEISTFIFIVLLVVLGVLVLMELVVLSVYGKPISKSKADIILRYLHRYERNRFDTGMLSGEGFLPYISKISSILFKYHIDNVGVVWRYSELAIAIDRRYLEVNYGELIKRKTFEDYFA